MQDLNIKHTQFLHIKDWLWIFVFFLREWEAQGDLALFTVSILIP